MKFKLNEIFALTRSLPKLTEKELPIRTSYRLLKFLKQCSEEMETLEKARVKLVEKYAEETEDKSNMKVSEANTAKFQEEFNALLSEEVEIDFTPIKISDLGDIKVSTNDLLPLQRILEEK